MSDQPPYQYIVLHASLDTPGMIAVHAAHAAGESCYGGPAPPDTRVVVLVAEKSADLEACAERLREAGLWSALIVETDGVRAGQATALGIEPTRDRERVRSLVAHFKMLGTGVGPAVVRPITHGMHGPVWRPEVNRWSSDPAGEHVSRPRSSE